jgi:hypothetical protein
MNSKNDGPDKTNPRPADQPAGSGSGGPKKPYATIDLKATEVKTGQPAEAAAKTGETPKADPAKASEKPAAVLTGAQPKPGEAKQPDAKPADPKAAAAAASAKPAAPTAKADVKADAKPAAAKPAEATADAKRSGAGVGSFFTHLAAGVVGGFLALLGADTVGQKLLPELGLPAPTAALSETTAQLQKRLAALESKSALPADATQKLAAAEGRIAKLEEARGEAAKLATEARTLAQSAAKQGSEAAEARIAKLEEKLASLVAAATSDPQNAGRIPALAAITGKLGDLETTFANQIGAVRKSIGEQIDGRMTAVSEASEQARSGVQRLDRDVATLKSDTARLKSDTDRIAVGLKTAQEDIATANSGIDGLRSDTDARMKAAAKPADVSAAVAPVASKLSQLEGSVESVVKSEQIRKANAERIVLSLELGNLKRVLDRGAPFATELAEVKKAAGGKIDVAALERYKDKGVATLADLTRDFRGVANAVLDADAENAAGGNVVDRLLAGAKSVVRVRKVGTDAGASGTEASLARIEAALKDGRLGAVIEEAAKLPPKALPPAHDWLAKVEARNNVDRAIGAVEASLKASLAAAPEATDTVKK